MRRGLRTLLNSRPDFSVCAEVRNGREAVAKAIELRPDIVIIDIGMPELNGIDAARHILRSLPDTEILILSVHSSDHLIREILASGICGFLAKSDSDRDLIPAVESLAKHQPFFTSRVTEVMLDGLGNNGVPADDSTSARQERLTSREREIVQLLAEGKSSKEVAWSLNISVKTAETHRANIMRKLEIHSVSGLVRYAVRNQIVEA
jgi:DNA-binding NarL/FixJ family response regulator